MSGKNFPLADPSPDPLDRPMTLSQTFALARSIEQKTTSNRIAHFLSEYVEPLMQAQASSGRSKTLYLFILSDIDRICPQGIFPNNENVVEGFGDDAKAIYPFSRVETHEYVKIIRLGGEDYLLKFWDKLVLKEVEETLKAKLLTKGEVLASTDDDWYMRTFRLGEVQARGCVGVTTWGCLTHFAIKTGKAGRLSTIGLGMEIT